MEKNEIIEIMADWNFWGSYKHKSIERKTFIDKIEKLKKTKEIVIIKGVRRSGKSTIILQYFNKLRKKISNKDILIINLEDPRFRELSLELLNKIYDTYLEETTPDENHFVVLDEVQEIKGWEKFVRFLHEAKKVNVFVTGSSSKLLSEEYSTLLSGRHVDLEMFPLSFKEFLLFKGLRIKDNIELTAQRHKIKHFFKEYMEFGGFPKIALLEKEQKHILLQSYFNDILIKDVQKRFKIIDVAKLEELAKYYLTNISSLQSFNKIRNILKTSLDTVERFSRYFSIARLFFFVPKFSYSLKQQILNPKKVYAVDVGLRNIAGFKFGKDMGRLAENIVFLDLIRNGNNVYFWRSLRQEEVDFVVKNKDVKRLIQVCWNINEENKKREIKPLLKASKELKCDNLTIINEDYEAEETHSNKKIRFIPLWKWLLRKDI